MIARVAADDASMSAITFNNNASIQMKSYDYAVLLLEGLVNNTHVTGAAS